MGKKLYVGGLSWGTDDSSLESAFSKCGTVVSARVIMDRDTNKSKGFGFVEMSTDEEAQKSITEFDGAELDGRTIKCNEAKPQEPRQNNRW